MRGTGCSHHSIPIRLPFNWIRHSGASRNPGRKLKKRQSAADKRRYTLIVQKGEFTSFDFICVHPR
jgi:hypothetical protein